MGGSGGQVTASRPEPDRELGGRMKRSNSMSSIEDRVYRTKNTTMDMGSMNCEWAPLENSAKHAVDHSAAAVVDHSAEAGIIAAMATALAAVESLPDQAEEMYNFFAHCYMLAEWSAPVNIAAFVLLLRRVRLGHHSTAESWRETTLMALLVSQKVVDDQPLANSEFNTIWRSATHGSQPALDVNNLELSFLKDLRFQVFVNNSAIKQVYSELEHLSVMERKRCVAEESEQESQISSRRSSSSTGSSRSSFEDDDVK